MKIHNYGNDYAQSMKFKNENENVGNSSRRQARKAGGESAESQEKKPDSSNQKTEEGAKEAAEKKEKTSFGKGKEKK